MNKKKLKPFLKWAGGKEQELPNINKALPKNIDAYYEPFVGGGAVYMNMFENEQIKKYYINDKSYELIDLYEVVKNQDLKFLQILEFVWSSWKELEIQINLSKEMLEKLYDEFKNDVKTEKEMGLEIENYVEKNKETFLRLIEGLKNKNGDNSEPIFLKEIKKNVISKLKRTKKNELEKGSLPEEDIIKNIETGFKSGYYTYLRFLFNNSRKEKNLLELDKGFSSALFFFIREYCYSSMFRYNANGDFNVPYGGLSYNRKDFNKKIDYLKNKDLITHLKNTTIENLDFEEFLDKHETKENDFIFLDPPYDSDFSTYANNSFDQEEQKRLANYLLTRSKGNFMMVIKNTDFIFGLYNGKKDFLGREIEMTAFDKKYMVSFRNRNDKDCEHLIITNYKIPEA